MPFMLIKIIIVHNPIEQTFLHTRHTLFQKHIIYDKTDGNCGMQRRYFSYVKDLWTETANLRTNKQKWLFLISCNRSANLHLCFICRQMCTFIITNRTIITTIAQSTYLMDPHCPSYINYTESSQRSKKAIILLCS